MKLHVVFMCFLLLASKTFAQNCLDVSKADVYLVWDSSRSIGDNETDRWWEFIYNMVEKFTSGPDGTHFGYGVTSTAFAHMVDLMDYKHFEQAVLNAFSSYPEVTVTDFALDEINRNGYLTAPTRGKRPGAQKLLLMFTDGYSQDGAKTKAAAMKLRDQGVQIFSIGVDSANEDELLGIAGSVDNVFNIDDPGFLDRISNRLFCKATVTCRSDFDYHPDPEDCSKFYRCSQGQPVSFSCGPGTMWAQETKACEYANKVNCGYRPRSG